MAVRKDQYQLSIEFITDESKRLAKTIQETKKFQNEVFGLNKRIEKYQKDLRKANITEEQRKVIVEKLTQAQKDLEKNINEVAKAGQQLGKLDLTKVAPAQLIQRARQLNQTMRLIPQSAPQYQQLQGELKQVNDQLAVMRKQTRGVAEEVNSPSLRSRFTEFFKNPLAIVGGIAAIGAAALNAAREISVIVDEVGRLRREITQLTGAAGTELDNITIRVRSIAQTFAAEENEILRTANTLVKEFQVSYDEAFGLIEKGFINGANASGEFLDNIREYSTQFKAAEFSAEDFINLSIRAQQEGIFSDKGLDVVKEFGLRIREQTTAVRDAMIGAFGRDFTNEIFQGINDGSITTREALQRIVNEMQRTEIPANRLQTVIADVFAAPGEDAGLRFITTLGKTQEALSDATGESAAYIEAQEELLRVNRQLAEAQNNLTKNLEDSSNTLNTVWVRIKTGALNALNALFSAADQTSVRFEAIAAATKQFFLNIVAGLKTFVLDAQIAFKNAQTLNPFADQSALATEIENLKRDRAELQQEAISAGEAYTKAYIEGLQKRADKKKIAEALNPTNDLLGGGGGFTGGGLTDQEMEKQASELEKRREKLLDIIKKYKQEEEIAELEAEEQKIAKLAAKFDQSIEEAKALEAQGVKDATQIRLQLEEQKAIAVSRIRTELLNEMFMKEQQKMSKQEEELALKRLEMAEQRKEAEKMIAEDLLNITLNEQQKALRDLELHQQQLLQVAQRHGLDTLDIEIAYRKERERIQQEYNQKETEEFIRAQQERANALADTFGALSGVFGNALALARSDNEEYNDFTRALALSQIGLSAAQGIAQAVAAGSGVPFPGNIPAMLTGVGTVLAQIASAQKLFDEAPRLAGGGYTGPGQGKPDQTGHRPAGIVHAGEWVAPAWMVQKMGGTIAALESVRQRGFAAGGFVNTTPISAPSNMQISNESAILEAKMMRKEFHGFRKEIGRWQREIKAKVVYTDIEDAGTTLNDIRTDASL